MTLGTDVHSSTWFERRYARAATLDDWLDRKILAPGIPPGYWIILGGAFNVLPTIGTGDNATFYYQSNLIVQPATGAAKTQFTADNDSFILSERLLKLALIWRWKALKRMDYQEDMRNYEIALSQEQARDQGARKYRSGLRPQGNFSLAYPWPLGGSMRTPASDPARTRTSRTATFAAPTAGWISNRNLATPDNQGGASGAAVLDNFFPTATSIISRRGTVLHATLERLTSRSKPSSSTRPDRWDKMFGATTTAIYDVAVSHETPALDELTNGDWSVVQFSTTGGTFLVGVNGEDDGFLYDGSSFGSLSIHFPRRAPRSRLPT